MATPSESPDNKAEKLVVIYVPALTISHLFSSVELGELLAAHSLGVSIVVCGRTADTAAGSFAEGLAAAHPQLSFHLLPHVTRPRDVPAHDHVAQTIGLARASDSDLREFLRVASPSPSALVLDFFCGSAVDVGAELGGGEGGFVASRSPADDDDTICCGFKFFVHDPILSNRPGRGE